MHYGVNPQHLLVESTVLRVKDRVTLFLDKDTVTDNHTVHHNAFNTIITRQEGCVAGSPHRATAHKSEQ